MIVKLKLSGTFVDKPVYRQIEIDESQDAVQLPDGTIKKVSELLDDALEQYIYEKYIKDSFADGRVLEMAFE